MFAELLDSIVGKVEGTLGAVVMGIDGIAIEKRLPDPDTNIEALAAEYTSLLRTTASTTQDIGQGTLDELVIATDQRIIVVRMITADYFLLVLLGKEGNLGRARFELKKAKLILAKEFAI